MNVSYLKARWFAVAGLIFLPALAWWATRDLPAWINMWALAGSMFIALKLLTLTAVETGQVPFAKLGAYIALWPGMDARAFLAERPTKTPVASLSELGFALLKFFGGLLAFAVAVHHVDRWPMWQAGWMGMLGVIFTLHFGLLHLVSWGWRRAGVQAPPIMRAPILADSLGDFWGGRWNAAFADIARRFLFKPTVRTLGVLVAGILVFLASGVVHEIAISLPARGGWGGPTLYFLLQGAGIAVEKSVAGRRLGLGTGFTGWLWTAFCTLAPVTLLFHEPFVRNVILPFLQAFQPYLP